LSYISIMRLKKKKKKVLRVIIIIIILINEKRYRTITMDRIKLAFISEILEASPSPELWNFLHPSRVSPDLSPSPRLPPSYKPPSPSFSKPRKKQVTKLHNSFNSSDNSCNGVVYCYQEAHSPNPLRQARQPNPLRFHRSLSFSLLQHQRPALRLRRGRPVRRC
jgi:hypothetical protein